MRYTGFLIILFIVNSCNEKSNENSSEASAESEAPKQTDAALLQSLKPLSLPLNTENLQRFEEWDKEAIEKVILKAIHEENVKSMGLRLRDSLDQPTDEPPVRLPDSYWLLGKMEEQNEYTAVLVGRLTYSMEYSLLTFTAEGKIIDKLIVSEKTGSEGTLDDSDSFIDEKGNILIKTKSTYEENLGYITEENYNIDKEGKFKKNESKRYPQETQMEWYHDPDVGLLSIEKERGTSIYFSLNRKSDEFCNPTIQGVATLEEASTYSYPGDENLLCSITLKLDGDRLSISQDDKTCPNKYSCLYEGDFKKITSEKRSIALIDAKSWMRMTIGEFSCMMKEKLSYEDAKFSCGYKYTSEPNPKDDSWYEGPEFPSGKVKMVHPLIKDVQIDFEHGDLRVLTIELEKEMTVQGIKKMFDLPEAANSLDYGIMQIMYGNLRESDLDPLSPALIKAFTLEGFDHMGVSESEGN